MSFEMNKIAGAILMALIVAMVSGIIASALVKPTPLKKNAYEVAVAPTTKSAAQVASAGPQPIEPLLATASVEAGKKHTAVCRTCHTFEKGGPNKIGPNLYGILGSPVAEGRGGYAFSSALKSKGGKWTVDRLNTWLTDPQKFAPGTKMTFSGFPKAKDRADVIAYLHSLNDHPQPLPTAPPPAAGTQQSGTAQSAVPAVSATPAPESFDSLLATASIKAGRSHTAVCRVCHTFAKGAPNEFGPNLYGIVGAPIGKDRNGYAFSVALKHKTGDWTVDKLNRWLTNPQKFAPGTKMTFPGFPKVKDRADVIAYLHSLSDHPQPLPKTAAPAGGGAKPPGSP